MVKNKIIENAYWCKNWMLAKTNRMNKTLYAPSPTKMNGSLP